MPEITLAALLVCQCGREFKPSKDFLFFLSEKLDQGFSIRQFKGKYWIATAKDINKKCPGKQADDVFLYNYEHVKSYYQKKKGKEFDQLDPVKLVSRSSHHEIWIASEAGHLKVRFVGDCLPHLFQDLLCLGKPQPTRSCGPHAEPLCLSHGCVKEVDYCELAKAFTCLYQEKSDCEKKDQAKGKIKIVYPIDQQEVSPCFTFRVAIDCEFGYYECYWNGHLIEKRRKISPVKVSVAPHVTGGELKVVLFDHSGCKLDCDAVCLIIKQCKDSSSSDSSSSSSDSSSSDSDDGKGRDYGDYERYSKIQQREGEGYEEFCRRYYRTVMAYD